MFDLRSVMNWIGDHTIVLLLVCAVGFYFLWFVFAIIVKIFQKTVRRFSEKARGEIAIFFFICTAASLALWIYLNIIKSEYDFIAIIIGIFSAIAGGVAITNKNF